MTAGYTPDPADVELVADALCALMKREMPDEAAFLLNGDYELMAAAAVDALTERLLPADAETRTDWAVRGWGGGVYPMRDRDHAEDLASGDPERGVLTRTSWVGPWLPVPTNTDKITEESA